MTESPSSSTRRRKPPQSQPQSQSASIPASRSIKTQDHESPDLPLPLREQTWLDPGTWSASTKFLPAYALLVIMFISIYIFRDVDAGSDGGDGGGGGGGAVVALDRSSHLACAATFNYSFAVNEALEAMRGGATGAADVGLAAEAALEIFDPDLSVFGDEPFPGGKVPGLGWGKLRPGLLYLDQRVKFGDGRVRVWSEAVEGMEAAAAMGASGVILSGRRASGSGKGAKRVAEWLSRQAPRFANGAIGIGEGPQVWAESVTAFAPFLAYYGVKVEDVEVVREVVRQIGLYRDSLVIQAGSTKGSWRHVAGPAGVADEGAWATGNALAAWGMVRTRATIAAWPGSNAALEKEIRNLDVWIKEILDASIRTDDDGSELLRNYLGNKQSSGESSGTSLLAAVAYRMATLNPTVFSKDKYLPWADRKRRSVVSRSGDDGIVKPAIDPANYRTDGFVEFSPQGQVFLVLLGTAWRDCVCAGTCLETYYQEHPQPLLVKQTMPWDNMYAYLSAKWRIAHAWMDRKLKYFRGPGQ